MPPPTISNALFSVGARGLCHAIQCSRLLQVTSYLRWFNHQVIKTDPKLRWIHLQTTNRVSQKIQFHFLARRQLMPPPTLSHALFSVGASGLCHAIQCCRLLQVTSYLHWFNHRHLLC